MLTASKNNLGEGTLQVVITVHFEGNHQNIPESCLNGMG